MHGPVSRPIKLWPFNSKPLDAVDRVEARTRSNVTSGKFTSEGVKDDALKFALSELVPSLHRARTTIKKAKTEVADRKSKLKVEGPDKLDLAGAMRRTKFDFLQAMKEATKISLHVTAKSAPM
jgi:hypothetical protein